MDHHVSYNQMGTLDHVPDELIELLSTIISANFSTLDSLNSQNSEENSSNSVQLSVKTSETFRTAFRKPLLRWFHKSRRSMPWRGDPFNITLPIKENETSSTPDDSDDNDEEHIPSEIIDHSIPSDDFIDDLDIASGKISSIEKKLNSNELPSQLQVIPATPYGEWVSEIMLQQTRVETVMTYYPKFMKAFPTISSLANSKPEEINSLWAGLGYYRRAQFLRLGAQAVMKDFAGILPQTVKELKEIPGIGPYTAGAISSIAYGELVGAVDGNVQRVLSRQFCLGHAFGGGNSGVMMDKICWDLADELVKAENEPEIRSHVKEEGIQKDSNEEYLYSLQLPVATAAEFARRRGEDITETKEKPVLTPAEWEIHRRQSGAFNQALMELGSIVCRPVNPQCDICPVRDTCHTRALVDTLTKFNESEVREATFAALRSVFPAEADSFNSSMEAALEFLPRQVADLPRKVAKKKAKDVSVLVLVVMCGSGDSTRFLVCQRPDKGLLAGQWEFPNISVTADHLSAVAATKDSTQKSDVEVNRLSVQGSLLSPITIVDSEDEIVIISETSAAERERASTIAVPTKSEPTYPSKPPFKQRKTVSSKSLNDDTAEKTIQLFYHMWSKFSTYFLDRFGIGWLRNVDDPVVRNGTSECSDIPDDIIPSVLIQPVMGGIPKALESVTHIFSHEKHHMRIVVEQVTQVLEGELKPGCAWMSLQELHAAGITTGIVKIVERVLAKTGQPMTITNFGRTSSKRGSTIKKKTLLIDNSTTSSSTESNKRRLMSLLSAAPSESINSF